MISCLPSILAATEPSSDPSMLWLRVVAFLGILGAGAYFLTQYNRKLRLKTSGSENGRLVVADTRPIGNKQYLLVAQYGEEKHLIGVTSSTINHLARLTEPACLEGKTKTEK